MLLVIDIGNTNIVVGGFRGEDLVFEFRVKSDVGRTLDEYAAIFVTLLDQKLPSRRGLRGAVVSSVVPPLTGDIVTVLQDHFHLDSLVVGPGIKTGIALRVADPSSVGADRVVNSVAVRELYGSPSLVVDFGTATTFDYVNAHGEYEGGTISPGLAISLESLVARTAKLPRIELAWPSTVVGKTTVHAMQSGALVGYVCMIDGLCDAISKEVGGIAHIVATGGLGSLIVPHSARVTRYDPHLTLKGMKIIGGLNGL